MFAARNKMAKLRKPETVCAKHYRQSGQMASIDKMHFVCLIMEMGKTFAKSDKQSTALGEFLTC